jgi:uncharacterized protein (UPF0332 family)
VESNDVVEFRRRRAEETLEEAQILADAGHWNACVNRLYYACFYAVSALLAGQGRSTSKHSGARALFHQHFVRTGQFPREIGSLYDQLYEMRHEGDYADFVDLPEAEVRPLFEPVRVFLAHARTLTG